MIAMTATAALFVPLVLLIGCAPGPRTARNEFARESKPALAVGAHGVRQKPTGYAGEGSLATFFDRNGDGRFEECLRDGKRYYDRNGDGLVDMIIGDTPDRLIQWDEDFDGILESEILFTEGVAPEWGPRRSISIPASRIFLDDRPQRIRPIPLSEEKFRFWEKMLKLR